MASGPMDYEREGATSSLNIPRTLGGSVPPTSQLTDIISSFRPTKLFKRDDVKDSRAPPHVLSLDYDDPGELLLTSESDETIQIYSVKDGRREKTLVSQKYGAKLARFTHTSSSIIYASTKQNDAIRYLATHDNSFIRYFDGHEAAVTCLAVHPGADTFISCSLDNTVRLWDTQSRHAAGQLLLHAPHLAAYDPAGKVFAVASPASGTVLLYDCRAFDRAPFATLDLVQHARAAAAAAGDAHSVLRGWTKLEFSNDGKALLVGSRGAGHFVLDAFDGSLRAFLRKPEGTNTRRLAPGDKVPEGQVNGAAAGAYEGSGDCCFALDGRYVISGARRGVFVWDLMAPPTGEHKTLNPTWTLEDGKREAAVVAFNPRYNFFATADQDVVFWMPDAGEGS